VDDARPIIHCLAGYHWPGGCSVAPVALTLDEAAELAAYGWTIIIDPFDWEILARWEEFHRPIRLRITT
jgi:hypothetical protein